MSLLNTKKFTALQALLTSAGFAMEDLFSAGEGENPIADALAAAKSEGAIEANNAFLKAFGLEGTAGEPVNLVQGHVDSINTARAEAEASRDQLAKALKESLGVTFAAEQSSEDLTSALAKAVAAKTAKQLAQAGHEPVEQPAAGSDSGNATADLSLEDAYTALAAETDPVKYKKIYNRIVELEAKNN